MKLKALFITFNIVLFLLLFTIFFFPLFYANGSVMREFWNMNWFLGPVFLVLIITVDIIFVKNRKLVEAIESEDWTALAMHLEEEIFDKKKFKFRNVRLLTDALILLSDFPSLDRLLLALKNNKSSFLNRLAPKFAAAKMLSGNYAELVEFSSRFNSSGSDEWMLFYLGLSLYMTKDFYKSSEQFKDLQKKTENKLIRVLSSYILLSLLKNYNRMTEEECIAEKDALKSLTAKSYNENSWKTYTDSQQKEIYVMVLKKLISDSSAWLWKE
ncbi:hypothetical protein [Treponema pedis]|uniref:hypothetical protein n=1 Tax=Treponema pedis TaxID=409322 RepID=UPI000429AB62|nr:hypothetical protein [Treponema pedis]QSI03692.1 hypothetical protein DYQ05_01560 [Treponema pedis]